MVTLLKNVMKGEEGASMIEYGLLVALIAVVCIGAVTAIGTAISGKFFTVGGEIENASSAAGS